MNFSSVGTLCNGHIGSMIEPITAGSTAGARRRQRKRRRKDGGRSVSSAETLKEWEEEEGEASVYLTYQGRKGSPASPSKTRKRSNSWSENLDTLDSESFKVIHFLAWKKNVSIDFYLLIKE